MIKYKYINYNNKKPMNLDEFIKKAKEIHGDDKYDYSLVLYKKKIKNSNSISLL